MDRLKQKLDLLRDQADESVAKADACEQELKEYENEVFLRGMYQVVYRNLQ